MQRPSRVSVPSTIGSKRWDSVSSKRWDSFLDRSYEPFDADQILSELGSFKRDLHGEPDLRRLRSFSSKEAQDVAAATRFRLELERREQSEYEDDYSEPPVARPPLPLRSTSLPYSPAVPEPPPENFQPRSPRQLKRNKTPEPIVVSDVKMPPEETQSAPLLSSRRQSPLVSSDEQVLAKSHRRHVTISEGASRTMLLLHSPSGTYSECTPPLPVLSPSFSFTTPRLQDMDMPLTPLSLNPPNEDQIRREIESFSLQDGADSLAQHRYRHEAPPSFRLESDDEEDDFRSINVRPSRKVMKVDDDQRSIVSTTPSQKRRKSIFSVFQRRSELDKLLDLYLSDDALEEAQPVKRKQSFARRMTRSRRKEVPEVPRMPPLPQWFPPESYRPG